ncbi:MAG: GNAT family N-acetyltransferase [Candidatus Thorarchaeota archaeon]
MEEIIIRTATVDDTDDYLELFMESAKYHAELEPRFQYTSNLAELTRDYYTQGCESDKSWTGFAILEEEIVGYISSGIRERGPIHSTRTIGDIEGLFVKPDMRGKGIATRLYDGSLHWFKERKIGLIHLSVAVENSLAYEFWRGRGFREFMYQMEIDLRN